MSDSENEENVIEFPGHTTLDIDPAKVLRSAINSSLDSVIVIGHNEDGLYMASSTADAMKMLWHLSKCQKYLLENIE